MTVHDVRSIRSWFSSFVKEYARGDNDVRRNMLLKQSHTNRVCREALAIGGALGLTPDELRTIEVIVLLHDVGRFEQYARYRTFSDAHSENHAKLTLSILRTRNVLGRFDAHTRSLIRRVIAYHNLPQLPPGIKDRTVLLFGRLMRDADKLDIWRLVIKYYNAEPGQKNHAISVGLSDTPGITREVYAAVLSGRIVQSKHLRNLNDFKVFQMGWVYDVNFVPTLRTVRRRKYLEKLRAALPDVPEADHVYHAVASALESRITAEGSSSVKT